MGEVLSEGQDSAGGGGRPSGRCATGPPRAAGRVAEVPVHGRRCSPLSQTARAGGWCQPTGKVSDSGRRPLTHARQWVPTHTGADGCVYFGACPMADPLPAESCTGRAGQRDGTLPEGSDSPPTMYRWRCLPASAVPKVVTARHRAQSGDSPLGAASEGGDSPPARCPKVDACPPTPYPKVVPARRHHARKGAYPTAMLISTRRPCRATCPHPFRGARRDRVYSA